MNPTPYRDVLRSISWSLLTGWPLLPQSVFNLAIALACVIIALGCVLFSLLLPLLLLLAPVFAGMVVLIERLAERNRARARTGVMARNPRRPDAR